MNDTPAIAPENIEAFIARWQKAGGSERANYQMFLTELAQLLALPLPDPASDDTRDNAYVFERRITEKQYDGSEAPRFIDLYRRGAFICEAKKVKAGEHTKEFGQRILNAFNQAVGYVRALPEKEGRPPFVLVVDVGNFIEVFAEFSRSGGTYTQFPDNRSYRIRLTDLRDAEVRERLRLIWLAPLELDPAKRSAKVTREIATQLATVAKALEAAGYHAEQVAGFLTRCLFTFFAEDVGLLPKRAFAELLESLAETPQQFVPMVSELWRAMDTGQFSIAIRTNVLHFNGKLFKNPDVLPLNRDQIALLIDAARADWKQVEPAIFGTLLERALNPEVRHALGAHYTPRSYVERLVFPTVIDPLREEWKNVQVAALALAGEGEVKEAEKLLRQFHQRLCSLRILDPACGSGNFLYVTMEHLKRLEGEVLNQLADIVGAQSLETGGLTVDPHQFLGIEINPRAAAVAEMVLWIGYLQWHFRTRGEASPPLPVLRDFHNIECRDAVLAYDKVEYVRDAQGKPVTRWDGKTTKKHPVTGEDVPDETAVVPLEKYVNPRKAEWPAADYVVGNPPFIGNKRMRIALGDGYVEALRHAWQDVPDTADFVMYWWDHAAELTRTNYLRAFGLITTNSLRQAFNRQVTQRHLSAKAPLRLRFVIADHPWVDSTNGAAVRIAMSVGVHQDGAGTLLEVTDEVTGVDGEVNVSLRAMHGEIHPDMTIGARVSSAVKLQSNANLCFQGMNLVGKGFRVTLEEVAALGYDLAHLPDVIKPHCNARDFMQGGEHCFVIDFFGMTADEAREGHPALYQWLLDRVKPERDHNNDAQRRRDWWLFGRSNAALRLSWAGVNRLIITPETSKHRVFDYISKPFCPDHKLYAICTEDSLILGVLSSSLHKTWSIAAGGRLGVGNDPTWTNTTCFSTFPFPSAETNAAGTISVRKLADSIHRHRAQQAETHREATFTATYNVLEKLRAHEPLNAKEKIIHENGLVSVLKQLHDELDLAVLDAYGWSDLAPLMQIVNGNAAAGSNNTPATRDECKRLLDETLLERLVALNTERAEEEKRGLIRWLRPEFQNPQAAGADSSKTVAITAQDELDVESEDSTTAATAKPAERLPWPKEMPEQVKAIADLLASRRAPLREEDIAAQFAGKGPWKKRLPTLLDMLVAVGRVRVSGNGYLAA